MVVSQERNLFGLLGCDVEDDPEFVLPTKKMALKAEKKEAKAAEEKIREVKPPVDTSTKRIDYQPRLDSRPYVVRAKNNEKNNPEAEAKAERLRLLKEAMSGGAQKSPAAQQNNNNAQKAPVHIAVQQQNPIVNRNNKSQGYYNGYSQRNGYYSQGGFRSGDTYQQMYGGYDGGYMGSAGYGRAGRGSGGNKGEKVVQQSDVNNDNDGNSWCYVGSSRWGKLSKMGSSSEDLSSKGESFEEGSDISRALEQQPSVGPAAAEDSVSVQAASEGDAQVTVGEEGDQVTAGEGGKKKKKKSKEKSTEGQMDAKPKPREEEMKPTFTLKEYEARKAEKRRALEAVKRSEQRKVEEDEEFKSMKLIRKKEEKNESVEEAEKKASKKEKVTEFVVTWFIKKREDSGRRAYERPGMVIRQRGYGIGKGSEEEERDGDEASSSKDVAWPPKDYGQQFPGLA